MPDIDYELIKERVERRMKERERFLKSVMGFLTANIICWTIWFLTSRGFPWPIFVTIGTGMNVISQFAKTFVGSEVMENMREREFQREVERERMRLEHGISYAKVKNDEKAKNGEIRLSDDGELIYQDEAPLNKKNSNSY